MLIECDVPEQSLSQHFFGSGSSNWCVVYMMAKQVQAEIELLQVVFVLNVSL